MSSVREAAADFRRRASVTVCAKLNGTTNGHVPSTGASSTVAHNKRIRTVRNNNRENSNQGRKTLAPEEESGIR